MAGAPLRPAFVLPTINTPEHTDSGTYDSQPEAVARGAPTTERSHARIIEARAAPSPGAFSGSTIARWKAAIALWAVMHSPRLYSAPLTGCVQSEPRHGCRRSGFGAARDFDHRFGGPLGESLLDGLGRMAVGQHDPEPDELEQVPEEEEEELALIYQTKGLPEDQAKMRPGG